MRTNHALHTFIRTSRIATCVAFAGFAVATFSLPEPANALPANGIKCRITTYYKTVALATEVGLRTNCPGVSKWGKTSKFFEVEVVDTGNDGPSGGNGGPGHLPCEFLAAGCSNLPEARN